MFFSFAPRAAALTTHRAEAQLPRSAAAHADAPQLLSPAELALVTGGAARTTGACGTTDLPVNGW